MEKGKVNYRITSKDSESNPMLITIKFSIAIAVVGIVLCIIFMTRSGF